MKLDDAIALRDRAIQMMSTKSEWQQAGTIRILTATFGPVMLSYRTPFQQLDGESDASKYLRAHHGIAGNLPFAMDIWVDRKKVFLLEWGDANNFSLITFKRGDWESLIVEK